MGNNNFTQTYADGAAFTAAKLTTALQTLTPDISNTTQMTSGTTSGTFLKSNGDGLAASFASVPDPLGPFALRNYGLSSSVSGGALTVALKTNAGSDPTSVDKVNLTFANGGTTTGTYTAIDVTGALSITLNASASLGYTNTSTNKIFVYAINNGGTPRLALSARSDFDQGQPVTTTTISAAADNGTIIYATATLSVVPRLLGWISSSRNSGGSWQTATRTALVNTPVVVDMFTADQIGQSMTVVAANSIGSVMTATGANAIATARTRATGTTASAGGVAISSGSGSFQTTNTTLTDVTNLTVTITSSGRPIKILCQSAETSDVGLSGGWDASSTTSNFTSAEIAILRDSSIISVQAVYGQQTGTTNMRVIVPAGSVQFVDSVAAGTYTYKIQARSTDSSATTVGVKNVKLVAYEL